jgi:sporulation and spore germination protein
MTHGARLALAVCVVAVVTGVVAGLLFVRGSFKSGRAPASVAVAVPQVAPPVPGRKIKARLFYVTDDGMRLASVERDVPFGEGTVGQARQIIEAQIAPAAEPYISAVPAGTTLRGVFATEGGNVFVDLSKELASLHPGGSTNETLTIYTLVNALTTNLPAVTAVQILVEGKEVETLSGHIDLRRPLEKNLSWVQ